jgi:hypothetical protein
MRKTIFLLHKNAKIANSVIKMTFFAHGGISIKLFVMYVCIINETFTHIPF